MAQPSVSPVVDVSAVICTRDRADRVGEAIAAVLVSLSRVDGSAELVVVDNASTDDTWVTLQRWAARDSRVRPVLAPEPGLGRARIVGVEAARGRVVVFTDDDVVVPPQWASALSGPMLHGQADLVVGGVAMATALERPWMTDRLRSRYYAHVPDPPEISPGLVGASMGATAVVLARIPFDEDLGVQPYPGAEDVLLYVQALELGYRVRGVAGAIAEHRFDPSRLDPARLLALAEGYGRCDAYYFHHWLHARLRFQGARVLVQRTVLIMAGWRARDPHDERVVEAARRVAFHRQLRALRGVPWRYQLRGERIPS